MAAGGPGAGDFVRRTLALSFALPPASAWRALAIFAHNLPIAVWPLLLTPLGAHRHRWTRTAADLLVTASLAGNVAPVGAALAAYGPRLIGYLPQLPLEWAALACGPAWWLIARRRAPGARAAALWVASAAGALLAAAAIETCLAGRA